MAIISHQDPTAAQKKHGPKILDPGIPLFYPHDQLPPFVREGNNFYHPGRSSDFRIILLAASSRNF